MTTTRRTLIAAATLLALAAGSAQAQSTGKLKVGFTVAEVRLVEVSKNLLENFKETPPPDVTALVKAVTGAQVVDLHGDTDEAATKALPEKSAPKKAAKYMTSEKMNQLIDHRNEVSTWSLYLCPSDSPMTFPNQPNSM